MNCQKGDVALNLARHLDQLKDAAEAGCHIAVFPEMSLTGYLNPESQRDEAISADDDSVLELAEATGETGVAALFGIVEANSDGSPLITQLLADHGRVLGSYSKLQAPPG